MQKFGRLGLGGVVVWLVACGGTTVGVVGKVDGGSGGRASSGADPGGRAGSGSDAERGGGGSAGASSELVKADVDVRNFATNGKAVYWIESGTYNEFQEYNGDGSVVARDLDSGEVTTLVRGLYRPDYLGVSAHYAYVFLNNHDDPVLRRYPLDSVDATAVEDVASYPTSQSSPNEGAAFPKEQAAFATTQDFSYFQLGNELHRIAETPGAEATLVFKQEDNDPMRGIAADDSRAYFRTDQTLYAVDAPGTAPTRLAELPNLSWFRLVDGYFYGLEQGYATRLPAEGGSWKRFAELSAGNLEVLGGYYYWTDRSNVGHKGASVPLRRGALNAPAGDTEIGVFPYRDIWQKWTWCLTRTGVYWATDAVYFLPSP
jgi:hypothetical protein